MNSPFLFDFVSNFRLVPSASIMTLAFSTGSPFMSFTTPRTIPVDWAATGGDSSATAASTTHATSPACRPFTRRFMATSSNESNSRVEASLPRFELEREVQADVDLAHARHVGRLAEKRRRHASLKA